MSAECRRQSSHYWLARH